MEGTVISARHQTAGRGQIGSSWESEAGQNITMSAIFFPVFLPPARQFMLTKAFSLAVRDVLARRLPMPPKIKWPNDIYAGDHKITGILLQNAIGGGRIQSCVAGFGVNVNQTAFPARLPNPTSLQLQTGRQHDRRKVIAELCEHLEFRYLQLKRQDWTALNEDYLDALYGLEETRSFKTPGGPGFRGQITGVDDQGRLLVRKDNGERAAYSLKEIEFVF